MLIFGLPDLAFFAACGAVSVASFIVFYVVRRVVMEGVCDEIDYPLANCDVSMTEELIEVKNNE